MIDKMKTGLPAVIGMDDMLADSQQNMADNIKPQILKIKLLGAGTNRFELEGSDELYSELRGIVIRQDPDYLFWAPDDRSAVANLNGTLTGTEVTFDNSDVPICASDDGVKGNRPLIVNSAGQTLFGWCDQCHFGQWESNPKGGKGKACNNRRKLMFLVEGEAFPRKFSISPTSLERWDSYCTWVASKGARLILVVTTIKVEEIKKGGYTYPVCQFVMSGEPEMVKPEIAKALPSIYNTCKVLKGGITTRNEAEGKVDEVPPHTGRDEPPPTKKETDDSLF